MKYFALELLSVLYGCTNMQTNDSYIRHFLSPFCGFFFVIYTIRINRLLGYVVAMIQL